MHHFLLLGYLFALMVGVAAAVTAQQFYSTYKYPFLRFLVRQVVFLNLALFIYFVSSYLLINFDVPEFMDHDSVLHAILYILAIAAWTGCLHSFIHLIFGLRGRDVPEKVTRLFQIVLILVGLMCAVGVTTYVNTGSNRLSMGTYLGLLLVTMLVFFSGMICLLRYKESEQTFEKRRAIRMYGWLHLVAYVLFFSPPFFTGTLKIFVLSAALICVNLIPLIWLRHYFLRDYVQLISDKSRPPLDVVIQKYQISLREREVMELILQGKSNQEIRKQLFISYNTVKNHIYSIYQKLGVKSRSQMIHFVLQALRQEEEAP